MKRNYKIRDRNNPTEKLTFLMNLYHSIDFKYLPENDKEKAKMMIKREVTKLSKKFGDALISSIKLSFTNKDYWDEFKNSIN